MTRSLSFVSGMWVERIAFFVLLAGIVMFPFPYGGITVGGSAMIEVLGFLALSLALLGQDESSRLRGAGIAMAALIAIAVLGAVQLLPLPSAILELLSPASARVYDDAAAVLSRFGRGAPLPRISIAPGETSDTVLLTLAFVAIFASAALLLRTRARRRLFAGALFAGAGLHVIAATVMRTLEPAAESRLHGAFVNPNHFAAYLSIVLALAFGVLWREVLHAGDELPRGTERSARFERRFVRLSTRTLLWGLFAAALGLTKSRGGILVTAVTLCLMLAAALLHPRLHKVRWAYGILGGGTVAAGIGFVVLAVRQQPILRFLASDPRDPAGDLRTTLWGVSIDAWQQFPIFGSGLGTFREAFRRVQPRDLPYLVEFAHSDPLQLLVTGGVIGLFLAAAALGILAARLLEAWWREERREESAFALAGLGALFAIALHGLVEFNLSIPAIPATLAAVLGLSWAATHGGETA